jgi:membrane associated rhomboid family serine protease
VTQPTIPVCYRHPSRETYLRCSRCDRPICPDCMHEAAVGQHCPECVAAGRRTVRSTRTAFGGTLAGQYGHVTTGLIALNVAVAVVVFLIGGTSGASGGGLGGLFGGITPAHIWGGMQTGPYIYLDIIRGVPIPGCCGGVAEGEYYRMLTSMFLHYGVFHLLMNMWALWVVGGVLEPLLGRARFLTLYLASGLGGSVATYLFADLDNVAGFPVSPISAGASGAVFGLFAAFYILLRRLGRDTSMITVILVVNLVLTFVLREYISIWGHLGGLVTGGVLALGLAYAPRQYRTPVQVATIVGVGLVLVVLTLVRTAGLT